MSTFLRALKEVQKNRSLAKIEFNDGDCEIGYVVYADGASFDMYVYDHVFNNAIILESEEQVILESEDAYAQIDFTFVKGTYDTNEVKSVVHNFEHKYPVDKTIFFAYHKNMIFDKLEAPKKSAKQTYITSQFEIKPKKKKELIQEESKNEIIEELGDKS